MLDPVKLQAPLKDYLWGGTRLREEYGKASDMEKVAESWELSCHKDGESLIAEGEDRGLTLAAYIEREGRQILGPRCAGQEEFPILIKFIDARDSLSVQVHPDNEYAERVEGEQGKTEMWYVLEAAEGARLVHGFNRDVTKEEVRKAALDGSIEKLMNYVPIHRGDVFLIEAGTVHAIGAGTLVAEIQESSNITYRLYDYNRVGKDGKKRELHLEKALEVARLRREDSSEAPEGPEQDGILKSCKYFTVRLREKAAETELPEDPDSFHVLMCIDGSGILKAGEQEFPLAKGETIFLPAGCSGVSISGDMQMLDIRV
jgi:mannose-6-phosphate isomerase